MKWAVLSSLHALSVHFQPPSPQERFILSFRTTWGEQLWENGKKQAIIINCKGLFLCKWILTGWGRRTGNASPPASPSGHPAGSYGCTALSRTCSRFLQKKKKNTHQSSRHRPRRRREVSVTRRHILEKHQKQAPQKEKQPAPCLCGGGDEFQRDEETLKRDKDKETERESECVGWRKTQIQSLFPLVHLWPSWQQLVCRWKHVPGKVCNRKLHLRNLRELLNIRMFGATGFFLYKCIFSCIFSFLK